MKHAKLTPCPFCGGEAKIIVCDDEGNHRSEEYLSDPWSGVGYLLMHDISNKELDEAQENGYVCPIAKFEGEEMGTQIYNSAKEAAEVWNRRTK